MSNFGKKFIDGLYQGLGIITILGLSAIAYAGYTWVNQSNLNTGDIVTAQTWNNVINNQNYLKQELDGKFSKAGGTLSGVLNMGANKITNLATPTANTDAVTKAYADSVVASGGGLYQISCSSAGASNTYVMCFRLNTSTGITECKSGINLFGSSTNNGYWINCNGYTTTTGNPWN